MVRVEGPNPFQSPNLPTQISTIADLVKVAESNPGPFEAGSAMSLVKEGPLAQKAGEIIVGIYPAMKIANEQGKMLELFQQADKLLTTMRNSVAGGRAFELARSQMGTQNTMLAGLLGTAIDSPDKMNLGWAIFHLGAIQLQGLESGELKSFVK